MNESPGESVRSGGGRTARRGAPAGVASAPRASDAGILRWTPKNLGALATRVTPSWEVFLTPDALRGLRRHASEAGTDRFAGLLVGRTGEGGERGRRFVLIEECRPHEGALGPSSEGEEDFHEDLVELREELGEAAVGWYHSHTLLGVFLSERDTRFHERCFPEPWHCAVVFVQESDGPTGGVFQRTAEYGLRRSIYVPFHEILADGAALSDGRRRTLVDWENYTADAPVARPTPLRPGRGRPSPREPDRPTRPPAAGAPEAGGAGPASAAAAPATEAGPAPASPPVTETGPPAEPGPAGEVPARGSAARSGPARRPGAAGGRAPAEAAADVPIVLPPEEDGGLLRRQAGKLLGLVAIVGLVVVGWLVWDSVVETSEGRAAAALAQAETWVRERTGAGEPASAEAGEEASEETPSRPRGLFTPPPTGDGAAGGADPETAAEGGAAAEPPGAESPEAGPPAVDPGADEGPADEPAGAGADAVEDAGEPPETATPPPQPAEDAAAQGGGAEGAGDAAPAVGTAFTEALERFQGAVSEYVGRRAGYDAGEVGCGALAEAYRQVDEAFLTLSARYGSSGGAGEAAARYGEAASGMEDVDRHFDASGCPRPR